MWRLFIAIPLPPDLKDRLAEVQRELRGRPAADMVRWTPLEQVHLTLRFLGDVAEDSVPALTEALRRACASVTAFDLRAVGLGCFPDLRSPRVLWAGVGGDLNRLHALQERVAVETDAWGKRETREFRAHLTLGRFREGAGRDAVRFGSSLTADVARDFGSWPVDAVSLMRSELSPAGARHSLLAETILSAAVSGR